MPTFFLRLAVCLPLAALAASCSTTREPEAQACLVRYSMIHWSPEADDRLLVTDEMQQNFDIMLDPDCVAARDAVGLEFRAVKPGGCVSPGDGIVFHDRRGNESRCTITDIYPSIPVGQ